MLETPRSTTFPWKPTPEDHILSTLLDDTSIRAHLNNHSATFSRKPGLARGHTGVGLKTKIDQNFRQNFILSHRFPRESCRSRQDLQLSLGSLPLKMKFCLEICSYKVTARPLAQHSEKSESPDLLARDQHLLTNLTNYQEANLENSLRSPRCSNQSSNGHREHLQKIPNFCRFWPS